MINDQAKYRNQMSESNDSLFVLHPTIRARKRMIIQLLLGKVSS